MLALRLHLTKTEKISTVHSRELGEENWGTGEENWGTGRRAAREGRGGLCRRLLALLWHLPPLPRSVVLQFHSAAAPQPSHPGA